MKKALLIVSALFLIHNSFAQKLDEITWFGIDFSQAKMVGSAGFTEPAKIQSYYLNVWNSVLITESDKYDLAKYYGAAKVKVSLDIVKKANDEVNADELVTDNTYSLSESDAQKEVEKYVGQGNGTGLVYIVEYFSKSEELASVYVIQFDISSGAISKMKKLTGKPNGFGFRNYWLGAIEKVMKKRLK
ncbi:hypothetical protein [uncultured Fluviicola sp.]|uniref:hypothetical protein n=1 Tax=uncultured Fluviicola sp. TaxID=463303 RepID=UPI0025DF73ED|nr:hypothetical protein [uncultured Fluviicola sp.]